MTAESVWEQVLSSIKNDLNPELFDLWVKPIVPKNLENNLLTLQVPNKFFSDWLKERFQSRIEGLLKNLTGTDISLHYSLTQELEEVLQKTPFSMDPIEAPPPQSDFTLSELNPRYTFDTFVVGTSNRFAQAAAEAVAKSPGKQYNPLFIYSEVGLGKTHLMHAIGHALRRGQPRGRVLYNTSEQFINEYINSLRDDRPEAFRNKYRSLDCLLIDDIQFLIGKGRSEEEFFYTFNALFDSNKQIVITSDRAPKEMSPMEQRLISRFEWGVVADIQPPDLETRVAILRKKAESEKLFVPEDILSYIATIIKTNIRELEGSLIRLVAYSSLTGRPLTVDAAKEVLRDSVSQDVPSSPLTTEAIQRVIASHFNLEVRDLKSKKRTDSIAFPRQIAMYLCRTLTDLSTTEIGAAFGGKDHTTVIHAQKKIKNKIQSDPYFMALINRITQDIYAQAD
ncbi:MAG: chromosomal replication initiator protein DnaA [Elusimicrobia bacterium]|nr:chromosomal replication initiator protein DnaA [Elusimicrobiota bacterium]